MIKEWNLLRTVACLSIVLLHSTTHIGRVAGHIKLDLYHFFRITLCYATPTFIVLSIIILANRYTDKLPNNFWEKRLKFIFLPYVSFAIIDAVVGKSLNTNIFIDRQILDNVLTGKYEGWFILVIFQLYFLYYFVIKYKLSMKKIFPISIIIMAWYLHFISGPITDPLLIKFKHTLKLPFIAWLGYFTIAIIIGKYYSLISKKLFKYRWLTILWVAISLSIIYISFRSGVTNIDSRRIDLYPLVLSVMACILAWGQSFHNSKVINTISNYSFGIYLLHWQIQRIISPYIGEAFTHRSYAIIVLFFSSLLISIIIIKLMSYLSFGKYIIGNIKREKTSKIKVEQVVQA
ncbi:acyltransferase family protein [Neobacillus mesonae]|uniref:acyltransferase family protein n=1 Tax=Neobacillus mesonae TaxID=1193713 RepID=UPI0025731792|nr:acyltransferase family protein [Neobacillus mesonae]